MTNTTEAAPTGAIGDDEIFRAVLRDHLPHTLKEKIITVEAIRLTRASDRAAMQTAVEALRDAEGTLRLVEHPREPDRAYHDEVKALGMRIGFGALMSTAEAGWREYLEAKGYPSGGEHVSGPCRGTVDATLARLRAALDALKGVK